MAVVQVSVIAHQPMVFTPTPGNDSVLKPLPNMRYAWPEGAGCRSKARTESPINVVHEHWWRREMSQNLLVDHFGTRVRRPPTQIVGRTAWTVALAWKSGVYTR